MAVSCDEAAGDMAILDSQQASSDSKGYECRKDGWEGGFFFFSIHQGKVTRLCSPM